MSFAVVSDTGEIAQTFPGDAVPDPVVWPNGDASHGANVGYRHSQWRIVNVIYGPDRPDEFHENTDTKPLLNGNTLTYVRTWTPQPLAYVQKTLSARIDEDAERQRQLYLTPGVGQAMVYTRKLAEAHFSAAEQNPNPKNYPLLAASVGIDGHFIPEVAGKVIAAATKWGERWGYREGSPFHKGIDFECYRRGHGSCCLSLCDLA